MFLRTLKYTQRSQQIMARPLLRHISGSASATSYENLEDRDISQNLKDLDEKGFTVVKDIFTPEQVKDLQKDYQKIKDKAYDIMENVAPLPRIWEESGEVCKS